MVKRLIVLASLCMLLLPSLARGEVYFAFSAEQMEYQGQQRIFFVPFSFTGPTHKQFERRIAVLFEKLHGSRQAVYGETYLTVKEGDGKFTATLYLDPGVVRFHEVILGEIYLTLANIGITEVHLGEDGKLLTDTDVKYPYFVPTIPLWEALPPAHFPHAIIRLGVDEYVESNTYYEKLKGRDAGLYARMTGLLKSDEPYVKLRVLGAFPLLQIPGEEDHLLPLLADKDLGVRYKAIELLKAKTDPRILNALASLADSTDDPETQLQAARILVKNGRNNYAIYILFEELKASDSAVVAKTLQKLAASGDKRVLTALVRQLTHASPDVRQAAFAGLKQMRDLSNLKSLLSNKEISEDFRKETAAELMRQQDAAFAAEGIKYLVKVHSGELAVEAITTVEMRGYKDQAELLVAALDHTDEQVALAAINAVSKLELIDLLPALSKAAVKKGLASSCRSCITSLLETQGLKVLMKKARSNDMLVRELAVLSLVKQAKARAAEQRDIDPILELLGESMKDKEVVIKRAAVQALHEIGGKRNWKRLLRMKKDVDAGIRMLVGQAALSLANEDGDTVILELLADEDNNVRLEAIKSIRVRMIKSARGKLKFMVGGRDKAQKTEAMRTIVALNESEEEHKEFFEIYKKLIFEMDAEIQLAAINGIQWIIDPMVVPLLQSGMLIMHKDPRVRAATLIALGRSRDHNVVEHIARGFADGEATVQAAAIEALRLMGHKKGVTPLQEYIKQSEDEELIQQARDAIEELQTKPKGLLD